MTALSHPGHAMNLRQTNPAVLEMQTLQDAALKTQLGQSNIREIFQRTEEFRQVGQHSWDNAQIRTSLRNRNAYDRPAYSQQ